MVVPIYPCAPGKFSFRATHRRAEAIRVEVPEGSELLPGASVGERLFVPVDRLVRLAHEAGDVVRAATARQGAFRIL